MLSTYNRALIEVLSLFKGTPIEAGIQKIILGAFQKKIGVYKQLKIILSIKLDYF
jgi:hypothetical protein